MEKLFTLLALQRQALEAPTRQALAHIIVNETLRLIPYQQAIFWTLVGNQITLEKVSGNSIVDDKGPYAEEIKSALSPLLSEKQKEVLSLTHEGKFVAVVLFRSQEDGVIGGLWLENARNFQDAETQILGEIAVSYAHALAFLSLRQRYGFFTDIKKLVRYKKGILAVIIFLSLLPVRQTITAPAEIVARDAEIITIPYDGMIEKIDINPGDRVQKDQVVAHMEGTALIAEASIAEQDLKVAESGLARMQREALSMPEKKAGLTILESEIAEKKIKYNYAIEMQKNSEIKALRAGTAIFADARKMQGKPVRMGEPLMMVANPDEAELLIRVPVDALVPIESSAPVNFYLNVSPVFGREAIVKNIGYQASADADGLLTYKVRAEILDKEDLRIGWQGTAKVKGDWTILSYSLLRRPFAAFRNLTGI